MDGWMIMVPLSFESLLSVYKCAMLI